MNSEENKAEAALEMDPLDSESPDIVAVSHIIASATRDCIALFDEMSEEKGWAQDQLTRFNVWANNIGVFARGHASLDYRLRDTPDILDLMMQQVGVLRANLEALSHPEEKHTGLSEMENTTESQSISVDTYPESPHSDASSLISGSDSSLLDFDSSLVVEETITRLYRLSAAIRKSGSHYRDLRAEKYIEVEYLEDGTSINLTERFLEDFALKVVPHRVPGRVDLVSGQRQPIAELWLQERLARTIAQRRNRFLYWRKHQEKLEKSSWVPQPLTKRLQPASRAGSQAAPDRKSLSMPTKEFQENSIGGTDDTRHTPIDKVAFPRFAASQKSSNTSRISFIWKNIDEIPGPPRIGSAETHFTCPLCFILCEAKESQGKYWTQHIFRDLKPYICLFKDCQSPNALFGSFREWIEHMLEDRKASEWLCASAAHSTAQVFSSERDFKEHLMTDHKNSLLEPQLSKLAWRSMRPAFRLFNDCPLCDFVQSPSDISEREAQDILQRHIAEHLQALSLLSLPNRADDGFTYASSEESSGMTGERSSLDLDALSFDSDLLISDIGVNRELRESVSGEEQGEEHSNVGVALNSQGEYANAENTYRETLALREKALGKEHPETLTVMKNLSRILCYQEKFLEAEKLYQEVLLLMERVFGEEHPDTLITMNDLAELLESQRRYNEAELMCRQVLALKEKVLGKENPDTLTSMNNLAGLLESQHKGDEAESMYRQTLALREKILGKEHPETLITMNDLAGLHESQRRYNEAELMCRQVLALREKVLGKEHLDTLMTMANLALVLKTQGKYDEAEPMYRQVLASREKILGKEHPDTLRSMDHLARLLKFQDKYDEAEPMYRQVLASREKILGKEHPDTLTSMDNLAWLLKSQDKYDEAEPMYRQVLASREKILGKEHPDTLITMNNLARLLKTQDKYDEAEPMYRQVLASREKILGKEHLDTLRSMDSLAWLLESQDKYDEAEPMYRQVLASREKILGKEHPDTLASMDDLAGLLKCQGKDDEAEQLLSAIVH